MEVVEIFYAIIFILLICRTAFSDIKEGMIYNKDIAVFSILVVIVDIIYYSKYEKNMLIWFFGNFAIVSIISLVLYFSKSFAGGDCKLLILLAALYPARFYLMYNNNFLTLYLAVGLAILWGYIYLIVNSILKLIIGKNKISYEYIKNYLVSFFKSFITSTIYIYAFSLAIYGIQRHSIILNQWIIRVACICIAYIVNKKKIFRKKYVLILVVVIDILTSLWIKEIFISVNWQNYILVMILLLCQMISRNGSYEEIEIERIKKGMILSTYSSMIMQNSRVRGLPKVSTEDLNSRLSEEEIESIKRWAKSRQVTSLHIVKKIPFAIFLELGFVSYLIIWSILV